MRPVPPPGAERVVRVERFSGEPRDTAPGWDGPAEPAATTFKIKATPFVWRDPRTIPPRQFLYDRHYARKFVSGTAAPSGVGKSSLGMVEAAAMVTGRPLLGVRPSKPLTVWYWNGEDPADEIERRFAAIMIHYGIDRGEVEERLFLDTGREAPIVIATMTATGAQIAEPVSDEIEREIRDRGIDCLILDPFVSTHGVPENDNGAIDRVAKRWARIADRTNSCVELIHHVRKAPSGTSAELTIDDARGAVSLIGATRSMRVLNPMSKDEAERAAVPPERRRLHFRIDSATGKSNMAPPLEKAAWYQLANVSLDNATDDDPQDHVGVVATWSLPSAFAEVTTVHLHEVQKRVSEGQFRADVQATSWVGTVVADVLDLDVSEPSVKQRIKQILHAWIKNEMFRKVEKQTGARQTKTFIEVGTWAQI